MVRGLLTLVGVVVAAGCGKETIEVKPATGDDYKHQALVQAVDHYVASGRSADAYYELAQTVSTLRPQMDRTVGKEAELKMIVLALPPLQSMQGKSIRQKLDTLAMTVWPTLLQPPIAADTPLGAYDSKAAELAPKPGEDPDQYIQRLCGDKGPLARDCKQVVPELQAYIVEAIAIRRGTERARNAVNDCLACSGDPGWHQSELGWETLDRTAAEAVVDIEAAGDPGNWPTAGAAAEDDPGLPEAQLTTRGDLVVGGHSYGPNTQRIDVLRELRADGDVIALHLHPDTTLAQARAVLVDARKAGAKRVAVVAREPFYPYNRKVYWVADGYGMRANLRPTDSLQLLLHAIDEVAGPGTVARVD
ncbi:MAG TPA: hypothetical protein VL326_31480 [Kofleriaceae bacterium]|jgi:hypothetical protein|nr:hypothetical protein [Kofleriaceae bacterium]